MLLGVVLLMMRAIRSSRTGRAMVAVRENERGVQAFGVNAIRTKLVAFAFSGFVAATAGGLAVMHQHGRLAVQLGAEENLRLFLIAVVGGLGSAGRRAHLGGAVPDRGLLRPRRRGPAASSTASAC